MRWVTNSEKSLLLHFLQKKQQHHRLQQITKRMSWIYYNCLALTLSHLVQSVSASVTELSDDAGRVMIARGAAVNFVKAKTVMKLANRHKRDEGEHGANSLLS